MTNTRPTLNVLYLLLERQIMSRRDDLNRLYHLFEDLKERVGGMQRLGDCTGYMDWPDRGVYFFFAADETRDPDLQGARTM